MVFRVHKTNNFSVICNTCIFDNRLSLKAKGLLVTMLALPEDWNYSIAGLVSIVKEGETSIRTALDELKEYKYLNVTRFTDEKGKIVDWVYNIYENPVVENPVVENPHVDNPVVENQPILNTNESITNELNTNEQKEKYIDSVPSSISKEKKAKKRFTGLNPSKDEVETYIKEKGFHVSADTVISYYTNAGDFDAWRFKNGTLVRDWKRCICTCERNWNQKSGISPQPDSDNESSDYYAELTRKAKEKDKERSKEIIDKYGKFFEAI